ncbi:RimK family alpha-L-glutamate ligase [Planctomyces sp. SH-PL62]|uniref:ATP-grasp domain-containing protein n=1 Tax=Planctomyces sp. SH-PL62 TaxID=1636152 RepID=UPI00078B68BF|nr:RimK family alpha-L-glutamate ligase [Planctomyces sp. SH-PL62]AMV36858.1 Alpha-aminoadipate--LysW ligase LysX [Planctomyces sp. SH-PL62]
MPTFAALVSGTGWHVEDLLRAASALDVSLHVLPFDEVEAAVGSGAGRVSAGGVALEAVDGVLVRMMPPGGLEQVVFRMDALHRLEVVGVPVWNPPRAVEAAVDKYLTLSLLERRGLPVPATWAGQTAAAALVAFDEFGGDVVVKPLFGSEGRGLMRVSHRELAWRSFHALERLGSVIYLQKWIRHPGHDLRLFVLGGQVLGAMRRTAQGDEWRTNVAIGGKAEAWTPDAEAERLAVAATEAVGAVFAGVDLIEDLDDGRRVLIEVNAVPGWRALSHATGLDVAAALLGSLREAVR